MARQVVVPIVLRRGDDAIGWREQIENEMRIAGVDHELMREFEVRGRARVVAELALARGHLDSAHVGKPAHLFHIAGMQMERLAGRGDIGIVVEEHREHFSGALEDRADIARDQLDRIVDGR